MTEKEELFKQWTKFKKAEEKAKKNRVEVEKQVLELYGTNFDEQSKSFSEEEIGYKVNIKKNIVHKLDQDAWLSTRQSIPEHLRPEKVSFSLDVKGFEYLKSNEDEIYKMVSDCVEIKENKPTVKIEKI